MDFTLDNTTLPENGDANAEVGKISLLNPIAASKPKIVSEGLGEKLWEFDARGDIKVGSCYWLRRHSLYWCSAGQKALCNQWTDGFKNLGILR